jgi:hypothetical protein
LEFIPSEAEVRVVGDQTKSFFNNVISDAVWDAVKKLWGPAVIAAIVALWEKAKHASLDWLAIGGLFIIAAVITFFNFRKNESAQPSKQKPAWQRLQWANSERERLEVEVKRLEGEVRRVTKDFAETSQQRDHFQQEYATAANKVIQLEKALAARPELPLTTIQVDAIKLASELLGLLNEMGTPPAPKWTTREIYKMPSDEMDRLTRSNDPDFIEACEMASNSNGLFRLAEQGYTPQEIARCTRLFPYYDKLRARYELEFRQRIETMRNRLSVEGVSDGNGLLLQVEGKHAIQNIRAIASNLWKMAYTISERKSVQ